MANKQFQALDCIPFSHDNRRYLRLDTSIDCESEAYRSFQALVVLLIVLYQLIPLVWFLLLLRVRKSLEPITSNNDETLGLFLRDKNEDLNSIRFLFNDYRVEKWWFEVAEMYR